MDPSAKICLLYDTFVGMPLDVTDEDNDNLWYHGDDIVLDVEYEEISASAAPEAIFCDANKYEILQHVKETYEKEGFIEARNNTNPFELIGNSIFINRAAVKLANIDTVHKVTGETFTFDGKTSEKYFTYCDVAAGPGGFTQYLQYRFPNSKGYGMTLRHEKLDWSTKFLNMFKFTPFYGKDNTGNLYTNWEEFVEYLIFNKEDGVDLVTADGGFDIEDNADKTTYNRQEFLSSRLLLTQVLVGIGCTKIGGNFVVKVFDTVTTISAHILFALSQCFDNITIFKPITSRPANAERYVICKGRKPEIAEYYNILADAAGSYNEEIFINSIFPENLPESYVTWLTNINNRSIDLQLLTAQNIIQYLAGIQPDIPQYDIDKFLIIWNLPDNSVILSKNKNRSLTSRPSKYNQSIIEIS